MSTHSPAAAPPLSFVPRVLLVDDFEDAREMYADYLSVCGFDTDQAASGDDGLAMARDRRPDVILMDLSLPGLDGWEVTRRLKGDPLTRNIPVIALTAHAYQGDEARARSAGCDAFVTKPCLPEQVRLEILRLLTESPSPA